MKSKKTNFSYPSILLSVSGGQDSMAVFMLLIHLSRWKPTWIKKLGILHCQHGWTEQDLQIATHLNSVADLLEIPYYCVTSQDYYLEEEAARLWRYSSASRIANVHGYDIVLTSHTLDDRLESFLLNLIRGSGLRGISTLQSYSTVNATTWTNLSDCYQSSWEWGGIDLSSGRSILPVALGRPSRLLERSTITTWTEKWSIPLLVDPTHGRLAWSRNRLRYELFPYLAMYWNPNFQEQLKDFLEVVEPEIDYLDIVLQRIEDIILSSRLHGCKSANGT
jgi:tRNA(Ile)-lysidine synthase